MASVLVTGSSGRIGRAAVAELVRRGHWVRGLDRAPLPPASSATAPNEFIEGSLLDRAALDRATRGVECLIHLAATPDDADFVQELLPNNLLGVYHLFESAREAGVGRFILASSGQVNWWQRQAGQIPIRASDPPSPRSWYAATKLFLEGIGRGFHEAHQIDVITVRLGWCPRGPEQEAEIAAESWAQDVYLSPGDTGRFFACAVEAPKPVGHLVVFAASRPRSTPPFDLESARHHLGYEPRDTWPEGLKD